MNEGHARQDTALTTMPAQEERRLAQRDAAEAKAAALARAEVEARYVLAMRHPRNEDVVRERLLKECRRPSFAKFSDPQDPGGALYRLPFGRDPVVDFSVRFMEAAARCWGNLAVNPTIVSDNERTRVVRVEVSDLEANLHHAAEGVVEKVVLRRNPSGDRKVLGTRANSNGETNYLLEADEREVRQLTGAEMSKCLRAAVKRHIPGWLLDECREVIEETMKKKAAEDPDAWRRKLLDSFGELNVPAADLHKFLGHDLATASPEELVELREVYAAVRDGAISWNECLRAKTGVEADGDSKKAEGASVKERLAQRREKRRQAAAARKEEAAGAATKPPAVAAQEQPPMSQEPKEEPPAQQQSLPGAAPMSPEEWERHGGRE